MTSYFCNEAVLELPSVYGLVDLTRQCLEVRTEEGADIQLVIERPRVAANFQLATYIDASLAERRRSLRGFEILSTTPREYPDIVGTEIRVTYIDRERGPLFVHEFQCVIDRTHLVYQGSCRMAHAGACDQWMQTTLHYLRRRAQVT